MKNFAKSAIVYFLSIIIISCENLNESKVGIPFAQPFSNISFPLDNETPNFSDISIQHFNEKNEEYLFLYNKLVNRLYKYNLINGQLIDSYNFQKEGDLGIGSPGYFKLINKDSLIFSNKSVNYFYITNLENSYNKRIKFNISNENRGLIPFVSDRSGIIFNKGKVYLTSPMVYTPSVKMAPDFFKDYNNSKFIFEYDILNDSVIENNTLFPIDYRKAVYSDYFNYVSQWFVNDKIFYSFPLSDSLIEYDISTKLNKNIYAGFSKKNLFRSVELANSLNELPDLSSNDQFYSFINQFDYDKLLYDEYRKFFYRFIEFPVPKNVLNIPERIKPLGILIFDQNFNKIGEYDLGYGKYTISHCFISSKGLNLINYEKVLIDESNITFDIFDFSLPEQL